MQPFLGLDLCSQNWAGFGPFWAICWAFLRHIVELEASKGLFDTRKSSWSQYAICFSLFGRFEAVSGPSQAKKRPFLAQNCADLAPNLALPRRAATRGLKLWIWKSHVNAKDRWSRVELKALEWSNGQNRKQICLLACQLDFRGEGCSKIYTPLP